MLRKILIYGVLSGAAVIASTIAGVSLAGEDGGMAGAEYLGYLIMLVALSVIFVAIRQYRDAELGGIITFGTAVLVGLGISAVAGAVYTAVWEVYLAATDYAFIDDYIDSVLAAKRAGGATAAELEAAAARMASLREQYGNPLFRVPMTFLEIFPVGLLVTLVSAAVLRRRRPAV